MKTAVAEGVSEAGFASAGKKICFKVPNQSDQMHS